MTHDYEVRLGNIPIRTDMAPAHLSGWVFSLTGRIEGWDEIGTATATTPHSSGDGQIRGLRRTPPRTLVLPLDLESDRHHGPGSLGEAFSRLSRTHQTTLYISEAGLHREIDVVLEDGARITEHNPNFAVVTLPLTADDPLRHRSGHVDLPAGTTLLPNGGDMQAWPIIEASGVVTFTVTHPGGTLNATMPSGPHEIHTRTGRMYNRSTGVQVHGQMSGPMPYVLPGGSQWDVGGIVTGLIRVRRWEAWS